VKTKPESKRPVTPITNFLPTLDFRKAQHFHSQQLLQLDEELMFNITYRKECFFPRRLLDSLKAMRLDLDIALLTISEAQRPAQ